MFKPTDGECKDLEAIPLPLLYRNDILLREWGERFVTSPGYRSLLKLREGYNVLDL